MSENCVILIKYLGIWPVFYEKWIVSLVFVKIGLQTGVWLWFLFSFWFVFEYKKSLLSKSKLCCDWKRDFLFSLFRVPEVCLSAAEP